MRRTPCHTSCPGPLELHLTRWGANPPETRGGDVGALADHEGARHSALGIVCGSGGLRGSGEGQARNRTRRHD